ncbi:MAG: hypothetical protein K2J65_02215, partial [Duncaniella sp.]|nr:hypothetical protein [Duncaniella sp.]
MATYENYKDSGVKWFGQIPSHWEVKKLRAFFDRRNHKVSETEYAPLSVTKNGIVPQMENVAKSKDSDNRRLVRIGDFVINSRSDRKGSSGVSELEGSVSFVNTIMVPRKGVIPAFCNYLLKSYAFIEENYRNGHGIVADLWTTSFDEQKLIKIAMPVPEEQKAIVAYLDKVTGDINRAIEAQQKMIDTLNERKQIIITRAVTRGLNPDTPLRYSGIDWLGEIPEHWEVMKLGSLGVISNGISNDASYFGEGFPFVSYSDVYKNFSLPKEIRGLAKSSERDQKVFSIQRGDVFFTRTSETADEIGFSSVCLETIPKAVFAGFLIRFRPKENIIVPEFSKFYFRASCHRNYFVKEMNLVTRASLSQQLLKG